MQQNEGDDRVRHEEQERAVAARLALAEQHQADQDDRQHAGDIDPPALRRRVEAVHELAEARRDEAPAGAVLRLQAVFLVLCRPGRLEDGPIEQRRHRNGEQKDGQDGQGGVEDAGEQAGAQPADDTDRIGRRRQVRMRAGGVSAGLGESHVAALP